MESKGDWVRLDQIVLKTEARALQLPEDTARVPPMLWVKGWLVEDTAPGGWAKVTTLSGREAEGRLLEGQTDYNHSFGPAIPELMQIAAGLKARLFGGRDEG